MKRLKMGETQRRKTITQTQKTQKFLEGTTSAALIELVDKVVV